MKRKFTKAEPGPEHSVIYTDVDGKQWTFTGGSRPWRNQNPGNLVVGSVSKRNGAIGKAGGFAVFSDYEIGHSALLDSLRNVHGNKTIAALMTVYAPPKENNTKKYIAFVIKQTGVHGNKKIKDFSAKEFDKLWKAIERTEGSGREGEISEYSPQAKILGVRKNKKGTIVSYKIARYGWVSKDEGISLTRAGKVDAVIASSSRGNLFLKARPNSNVSDNLGRKG